jgi:predicted ABC-type ATPase
MVEKTLRALVSIEQARVASTAAFRTETIFVGLRDVEENIRRAKMREAGGGRAVTEETICAGHRATMANVPVALRECHRVTVVDNTANRGRRVLEMRSGEVTYAVDPRPRWLADALAGTEFEV